MVAIQSAPKVETVLSVQTDNLGPLKGQTQAGRINQLVVANTSLLKGILWGIATLGFAKVTLDCLFTSFHGARLHNSITILDDVWDSQATMNNANTFFGCNVFAYTSADHFPLAYTPIAPSVLTFAFGLITSKCYRNCEYHLGSRQVKAVQLSK